MNRVEIIGRLTKDPDCRYSNDLCVSKFTVAIDRKKDDVDYVPCVAFGKTGELVEKHIKKGQQVGVCGSIKTGSYTNKEGKKVYTTEVIADSITFIDRAKKEEAPQGFEAVDDELPF